jgi:hypothetical protein
MLCERCGSALEHKTASSLGLRRRLEYINAFNDDELASSGEGEDVGTPPVYCSRGGGEAERWKT